MPSLVEEQNHDLEIIRGEREAGRLSEAAESAFFRVAHRLAAAANAISERVEPTKAVASVVPVASVTKIVPIIGTAAALL